jgi:Domain of unknown function (DUF4382)
MHRHIGSLLVVFLILVSLAACNSSGNGEMQLSLTDAPADNATSVVVDIISVQAIPLNGNPVSYTFSQPQQIDLLQLQEGLNTPLIGNWILPAGQYKGLVLTISADGSGTDSYIVLNDGSQHALVASPPCGTPCSGSVTLNINTPFYISNSFAGDYLIDFDARKSILPPASGSTAYQLSPIGRMIDVVNAGNIIGVVPNPLITSSCTPVVYVFAGDNTTPSDLDDSAPAASQPVTESAVHYDTSTGEYNFTAAYLTQGDYTLAFTCQAAQDDPATADNIDFTFTGSLQVVAQQTVLTTLNNSQ